MSYFKAGEAARISGVSQFTQRNWRRFGFLPNLDTERAFFSLHDICYMRLLFILSRDAGRTLTDATKHLKDNPDIVRNLEASVYMLLTHGRRCVAMARPHHTFSIGHARINLDLFAMASELGEAVAERTTVQMAA